MQVGEPCGGMQELNPASGHRDAHVAVYSQRWEWLVMQSQKEACNHLKVRRNEMGCRQMLKNHVDARPGHEQVAASRLANPVAAELHEPLSSAAKVNLSTSNHSACGLKFSAEGQDSSRQPSA